MGRALRALASLFLLPFSLLCVDSRKKTGQVTTSKSLLLLLWTAWVNRGSEKKEEKVAQHAWKRQLRGKKKTYTLFVFLSFWLFCLSSALPPALSLLSTHTPLVVLSTCRIRTHFAMSASGAAGPWAGSSATAVGYSLGLAACFWRRILTPRPTQLPHKV